MKKKYLSLVFLVAVVSFTTVFFSSDNYNLKTEAATVQENKKAVQSLESDLKSIQDSLASIQYNINKAKTAKENQLYIKSQLDQEITLTETKVETLEKLIEEYNTQISEREAEIDAKNNDIDDALFIIRERLILQHENGNSNIISYVLGSSDFAELLTRIEIANALFEYDKNLIEKLTNDRIELTALKDELTSTRDKCTESIAELELAKSDLQVKIDESIAYINEYRKDEAAYQAQYDAKASEMESIENEIKDILRQIELQERTNYSNDEFRFPLAYDATYWNTGGFGWRVWSNGRKTDYHKGVDFAAARGTPIYASNSGTVILHRNSPSYGLYLIIDHGGGVTSLYAHCSKLLVSTGDEVKKGDKIAEVGSTGDSTGNHLHFSILENGVHVDPMNYISEP
ncbi:MAG: peptidoglycan DD-metalloendopeptidase family protein [Clostridia bacterium]|nr:peptidoglycan DD-metalloendopeptidase family protein [Clostridia bacterium]